MVEEQVPDLVQDDVLLVERCGAAFVEDVVLGVGGQPQPADSLRCSLMW
jgi:hypothetical protein